jgi:adenosine deaminase
MMDSEERKLLVQALPKAEIHCHIEGTLEPEMMLRLAGINQVDLPYSDISEIKAAYQFNCLQDFLDLYYQGMSVLQTRQDFYDLCWAYLLRCRADNVVHTEIFFDPQGHTDRGVEFETVIEGLTSALEDGQQQLGISSRLIMCFLRHLDEAAAFETLEQAAPWLGRITGVGLDSSEVGHPPSKFQRVFARAGELGLKRVAHAGEEGPAEYVVEALDRLQVDRIDHGNRSLDDNELVQRLALGQVPLTVCPQSNLRLGVIDDMHAHPISDMLSRGLKATVNSDDPAYFGAYVNENFFELIDALDLSEDAIEQLIRNSFEASFLDQNDIEKHLSAVGRVCVAAAE